MSPCENKVYSILGFKMRLNWLRWHHGYLGIAMMVWGVWWMLLANWWGIPIFILGGYIAWDDFILQHHRQVKEYNPCYHSPLHRLYGEYLYKFWIVRKLNEFADWLFANPLLMGIIVCIIIIVWRLS